METLKKLAPFMLRARVVEVGRDRLSQIRNKLAFIIITDDISENSRDKVLREFKCPIFQCLTEEEVESIFNFKGTKMLGFSRSPLSESVIRDLKPYRITLEMILQAPEPLPTNPTVAVLGASGIGKHHCNWWTMEGATPIAFLGSSPESVASTQNTLHDLCGFKGRGYSSLQELLEKDKPDIVDVCLPPALHYHAVKTALEAGCHVLCEKPFVYDDNLSHDHIRKQAEELKLLAGKARRMLGVCTQYVMAVQECLALQSKVSDHAKVNLFEGTLISPTRNRPPCPKWTWIDLAPHMLGVAQVLSNHGQILWPTLEVDFQGHMARAIFDCKRPDGSILHCNIHTLHRDEEPKNVRQIALDGNCFDIGGFKDENGVFQMRINSANETVDRPDMLRLLIRSFINGKIEMPAAMARQNLNWMLGIIEKAAGD